MYIYKIYIKNTTLLDLPAKYKFQMDPFAGMSYLQRLIRLSKH